MDLWSWILVFTNLAFLFPAWYAYRMQMHENLYAFISITVVSGLYHYVNEETQQGLFLTQQHSETATQTWWYLDHFLSFSMLAQTLRTVIFERDESIAAQHLTALYQIVVPLVVLYTLVESPASATFSIAIISFLMMINGLVHLRIQQRFDEFDLLDLAVGVVFAFLALGAFLWWTDGDNYGVVHSLGHVLAAISCAFLLASRDPQVGLLVGLGIQKRDSVAQDDDALPTTPVASYIKTSSNGGNTSSKTHYICRSDADAGGQQQQQQKQQRLQHHNHTDPLRILPPLPTVELCSSNTFTPVLPALQHHLHHQAYTPRSAPTTPSAYFRTSLSVTPRRDGIYSAGQIRHQSSVSPGSRRFSGVSVSPTVFTFQRPAQHP